MFSLLKTFKLKSMFQLKDRIKLKILNIEIFPQNIVDRIPSLKKMKIFKDCLILLTKVRIMMDTHTLLFVIIRATIKTFKETRLKHLIFSKMKMATIHIRKLWKMKKKKLKFKTNKFLKTPMILRASTIKMMFKISKRNLSQLILIKNSKMFKTPKTI